MVELADHIRRELVIDLQAPGRDEAIRELVDAMKKAGVPGDLDDFYQRNIEREAMSTTAMGLGVAVPHAHHQGIDGILLAVGRSVDGIDFAAPDGAPVHLVFLIAGNGNHSLYLRVVARIAWLVRNDALRERLVNAPDAVALHELLSRY